jgi:hypothetical protein
MHAPSDSSPVARASARANSRAARSIVTCANGMSSAAFRPGRIASSWRPKPATVSPRALQGTDLLGLTLTSTKTRLEGPTP